MYSFAFSMGCSVGSRLRWTLITSCDRSRVHASSLRVITLTFMAAATLD